LPLEFFAQADPPLELCSRTAALAPENPFCTPSYLEARRAPGLRPWVLGLATEERLVAACFAFLLAGRASRTLEIPSLPEMDGPNAFWDRLLVLCREEKVTYLDVDTYGSPHVEIPRLARETGRSARWEYVLDLQESDSMRNVHVHHRRMIQRAHRHQLEMRQAANDQAGADHVALMSASMRRRRLRGEDVPVESDAGSSMAYIRRGAGDLFQAVHGDRVLSSVLVLKAEQGAYYQSAGTSAEGMACGASHFLVAEIASRLQRAGLRSFNLGGTRDAASGLARFKSRFGARVVKLESARFYVGAGYASMWLRTSALLLRKAILSR